MVTFDLALRVHHHNAIVVVFDLIVFDDQVPFTVNHENAFLLRVLNIVVHDSYLSGGFAATSNVRLHVTVDFVGENLGVTALSEENTLVEIMADEVRVWETLNLDALVLTP